MNPGIPLFCGLALWLLFATTHSRPTYEDENQKERTVALTWKEPYVDPAQEAESHIKKQPCIDPAPQGTTTARTKTCMYC